MCTGRPRPQAVAASRSVKSAESWEVDRSSQRRGFIEQPINHGLFELPLTLSLFGLQLQPASHGARQNCCRWPIPSSSDAFPPLGGFRCVSTSVGLRRCSWCRPKLSRQFQGSTDVRILGTAVEGKKLETVRALHLKAVTNPLRPLSEHHRALGAFYFDLIVDHSSAGSQEVRENRP
jgi:hypothetical protein